MSLTTLDLVCCPELAAEYRDSRLAVSELDGDATPNLFLFCCALVSISSDRGFMFDADKELAELAMDPELSLRSTFCEAVLQVEGVAL